MTTGWAELLRDAMIEVAIDVFRCMEHRLPGTVITSELRSTTLAAIDSVAVALIEQQSLLLALLQKSGRTLKVPDMAHWIAAMESAGIPKRQITATCINLLQNTGIAAADPETDRQYVVRQKRVARRLRRKSG
jgi:hypothetical protein